MKIAIFHDYTDAIGGGEKLVLTLAKALKADVITTDIDKDAIRKMGFDDINIISLGNTIKLPPMKQITASIKFFLCNFTKKYDFFIFSGNWAYFAAKRHKPNIYYCNTPVRVFYDSYDSFLDNQPFIVKPFFIIWVFVHRRISEYFIDYVQRIIANSKNIQSRIKIYLNKDSKIIYPPIDVTKYYFKEFGDFWLSVNRLYPEKRVELQIEAFRSMPDKKLIIVGDFAKGDHSSKYAERLMRDIPKNVELKFQISQTELIDLYSRCRGLIATAIEEDFGMTIVEAMASGKPIVCTKEGGYKETMVVDKTGIFIKPELSDIKNAIDIISKRPEIFKDECIKQSENFDVKIFIEKMKKEIYE